jgi:multimeric flavodoxin WrbA
MTTPPRALILDGSDPLAALLDGPRAYLIDCIQSAGWQADLRLLYQMSILPCCGNFSCWVKTPGECASGDSCAWVAEAMMGSDLLVLLSPVVFGTYTYELKKAVDHLIPNISPFMTTLQGETHHSRRYKTYPALLSVGYLPAPDPEAEALYICLFDRNALNLYPLHRAVTVLTGAQSPAEQRSEIERSLRAVGVGL